MGRGRPARRHPSPWHLRFGCLALWPSTRRAAAWVFGALVGAYGGLAGYVWALLEPTGPHEASDAFVLAAYFLIGMSGPLVTLLAALVLIARRGTRSGGFRVLRWLPLCLLGAALGFAFARFEAGRGRRLSPVRAAQAWSVPIAGPSGRFDAVRRHHLAPSPVGRITTRCT
jgi:hypothetical protein